jgi:hypothetical protein
LKRLDRISLGEGEDATDTDHPPGSKAGRELDKQVVGRPAACLSDASGAALAAGRWIEKRLITD